MVEGSSKAVIPVRRVLGNPAFVRDAGSGRAEPVPRAMDVNRRNSALLWVARRAGRSCHALRRAPTGGGHARPEAPRSSDNGPLLRASVAWRELCDLPCGGVAPFSELGSASVQCRAPRYPPSPAELLLSGLRVQPVVASHRQGKRRHTTLHPV